MCLFIPINFNLISFYQLTLKLKLWLTFEVNIYKKYYDKM